MCFVVRMRQYRLEMSRKKGRHFKFRIVLRISQMLHVARAMESVVLCFFSRERFRCILELLCRFFWWDVEFRIQRDMVLSSGRYGPAIYHVYT